jgi:hypothetical protein
MWPVKNWMRYAKAALRAVHYAFQKITKVGFDAQFEFELERQADLYLSGEPREKVEYPIVRLESINLEDNQRFVVFKDDIYRRFVADDHGEEVDDFGRKGRWIPRGCVVYYDQVDGTYVKVFDSYATQNGEARFLQNALDRGIYGFLCPNLHYLIVDENEILRGYAIREGETLTRYEFERFVGRALRDVILAETERTQFYFNDLEFHNVIRSDGRLSIIDLESVVPVSWFRTDLEFARRHLKEVDIGWPIQSKWRSPRWYQTFLVRLKAQDTV